MAGSQPPPRTSQTISDITAGKHSTVIVGNVQGLSINSSVPVGDGVRYYSRLSLRTVARYVDRPALHGQMREGLHDCVSTRDAVSRILVVCGLGGAGKTQLALNYIQASREDYQAVFWLDAESKDSIERDYLRIYHLLFGLRQSGNTDERMVDVAIDAVRSWCHHQHVACLFVFDGADIVDSAEEPGFVDLPRYMPDAACVDIIVTTRSQTVGGLTELQPVHVGDLEVDEAIELFLRCSTLRLGSSLVTDDVVEKSRTIVHKLGHFALAITLAGSYLAVTPRLRADLAKYLTDYEKQKNTILGQRPKALVHRYAQSVLTTWETSYAAVVTRKPAAGPLLGVLAFLSFDDLFPELFDVASGAGDGEPPTWWGALQDGCVEMCGLEDALAELASMSLIQQQQGRPGYSMHKLVQSWAYDRLLVPFRVKYGGVAADCLLAVDSKLPMPIDKVKIVPHVMATFRKLRDQIKYMDGGEDRVLHQIWRLARYLRISGEWSLEHEMRQFIDECLCHYVQPGDRLALQSTSDLGSVQLRLGKLQTAEVTCRQAIKKFANVSGRHDEDVRAAEIQLANVLFCQGRLDDSLNLVKRCTGGTETDLRKAIRRDPTVAGLLLAIYRQVGVPEMRASVHRWCIEQFRHENDWLGVFDALSTLLESHFAIEVQIGTWTHPQLETLTRQLLEIMQTMLGEDHPYTLSVVSELADCIRLNGRYAEAEAMMRTVREMRIRISGTLHLSTHLSTGRLAYCLYEQKRYAEAEELYMNSVEGLKRVAGNMYPHTMSMTFNLARTLFDQNKLRDAEAICRGLIGRHRQVGVRGYAATTSIYMLAEALQARDSLKAAEAYRREVLDRADVELGTEDPTTIANLAALAVVLQRRGKLTATEDTLRVVLARLINVVGANHPHTLDIAGHFARLSMLKFPTRIVIGPQGGPPQESTQQERARRVGWLTAPCVVDSAGVMHAPPRLTVPVSEREFRFVDDDD